MCIYIYIWIIYINFKTPEYDTNVWTIYINFKCVWQYPQLMYTQSWCFTARQRRSHYFLGAPDHDNIFHGAPETQPLYFQRRARDPTQQHTQIHTHANIAIVYHSWHFDNHLSIVHRNIFLVFWYVFIQSCIFRSRAVGVKQASALNCLLIWGRRLKSSIHPAMPALCQGPCHGDWLHGKSRASVLRLPANVQVDITVP